MRHPSNSNRAPASTPGVWWWGEAEIPQGLTSMLVAGGTLLIPARFSCESGRHAYNMAALDLAEAVEQLEALAGIDVTTLVPDHAQIVERLREATPQVSFTQDGARFTNRFATFDFSAEHQVVMVVSAGSGTKVESERFSQPVTEYLVSTMDRFDVCAVAPKRLDRVGRVGFELGPLVICGKRRGAWYSDNILDWDTFENHERRIFELGHEAGRAAKTILVATRTGMRQRVGRRMEHGNLDWSYPRSPPPGFARMAVIDTGRQTKPTLFLDCPEALPAPETVSVGYPQVVDEAGAPVDQVANVQFFLSHYGLPDWPLRRIARELCNRRYSTCRLRELRRNQFAVWTVEPKDSGWSVVRSILENLDVYETGTMVLTFKKTKLRDVTVTNLFPLSGQWATAEDFARIRAYQADEERRSGRSTSLVFSGLRVELDGEPGVLHSTPAQATGVTGHQYIIHKPGTRRVVSRLGTIAPEFIGQAICDSIAAAGESGLTSLASTLDPPDTFEFDSRIEQASSRAAVQRAEADRILAQLTSGFATGALLQTLNQRFNDADAAAIGFDREAEQVVREREAFLHSRTTELAGAPLEAALAMVASLRDHRNLEWRHVWRQALQDIRFTRADNGELRITGGIRLGIGPETFLCRLDRVTSSRHPKLERRANEEVEGMRQGRTLDHIPDSLRPALVPFLVRKLGYAGSHAPILNIRDPRLMRLAMAVAHPTSGIGLQALADQLGEPLPLLERLQELYGTDATYGGWLRAKSEAWAELYLRASLHPDGVADGTPIVEGRQRSPQFFEAAVRNNDPHNLEWEVTRGARTFRRRHPCKHCGSGLLAYFRLREVNGIVCLACRRDKAGVIWPPDPYDKWLEIAERWVARTALSLHTSPQTA